MDIFKVALNCMKNECFNGDKLGFSVHYHGEIEPRTTTQRIAPKKHSEAAAVK